MFSIPLIPLSPLRGPLEIRISGTVDFNLHCRFCGYGSPTYTLKETNNFSLIANPFSNVTGKTRNPCNTPGQSAGTFWPDCSPSRRAGCPMQANRSERSRDGSARIRPKCSCALREVIEGLFQTVTASIDAPVMFSK